MKNLKRILIITVMTFILVTRTAYGIEPLALNLESFNYDDGAMKIFFNTSYDQELKPEQLTLSIGNKKMGVSDLKRVESAEAGVTYLFLVDVSGSMSDNKLKAVKQILKDTLDRITEKDNACIFSVGNDAYTNPVVSSKSEYQSQIDAIERKPSEDTNLYSSIVKGLDVLQTRSEVHEKKCLIILSDGEDVYPTGITRDEVYKKIESCHIPVFTIAMMEKKQTQKMIEASKTLGSFARYSPGGLDMVFGMDETTSSELAVKIVSAVETGYVLIADLSDYISDGKEQVLKLELIMETGSVSDSYTIETNGFTGIASPSPAPEPENIYEDRADEPVEPVEQSNWLLLIFAIVAGVVIIAIIIIILLKTRKKKNQNEDTKIDQPDNEPTVEKSEKEAELETTSISIDRTADSFVSQPEPQEPDVTIVLTKMDHMSNQVYMVDIFGSIVIGRTKVKSDLSFPDDVKLSSAHCQISFSSNKLYLKDLNSTNGTFVNGIPISSQYKLEKDDVLQIGSLQFRINW